MFTSCSSCQKQFVCGADDPASLCWCAKKPTLAVVKNDRTCLCETCLDNEIERVGVFTCFRLFVAYVGTNFCGFQEQANGRTVEGELKKALRALIGSDFKLDAAGRTDAGVHARGQVLSLTCTTRLLPRQLMLALSTKLALDLSVWRVDRMPHQFDARRQSVGKRYVYRIYQGFVADPFHRAVSYFVPQRLDVAAMQDAAQAFVGEHDFESFRASLCTAAHARRSVWHVSVRKIDAMIEIDIRGNAFCMNMVRIMAGTLVEVGKRKRDKASILHALAMHDRRHAGPTAPAHGLTLEEIYYPDDLSTSLLPSDARFPRYPVTHASWGFSPAEILYGEKP